MLLATSKGGRIVLATGNTCGRSTRNVQRLLRDLTTWCREELSDQGSLLCRPNSNDDGDPVSPPPRKRGKLKRDDDCDVGNSDSDSNIDGVDHDRKVDPDEVVMVGCYKNDDLDDKWDHKFRTMILFLPQCSVLFCARERRWAAGTGMEKKKMLNELYRLTSCKNSLKESLGTRPRRPPK
jgi:hypothetical protein